LSSMNVWLGTPVPAPAALALFGIAGLASKCRRK
jgi:MYXO-CTERM domain-containing protein